MVEFRALQLFFSFFFFSTLIVYKCPFRLCHSLQHHAYLITETSLRTKAHRLNREWTLLKSKVLAVTNKYSDIISKIGGKNKLRGLDRLMPDYPHQGEALFVS